jgi:cell division control protein CDC15
MKEANPQEQYEFQLPVLGRGSFGVIYKALRKHDKRVFCRKQRNSIQKQAELQIYLHKYERLRTLNRPNIIEAYEAVLFENIFYIVLEYADYGDLQQMVGKTRCESELIQILCQVVEGIGYLYEVDVIHRDLRPENLLKFKNGAVKIADFGQAKVFEKPFVTETIKLGTWQIHFFRND